MPKPTRSADKPLRPMERAFVLAYVGTAHGVGKRAAILAGYSAKTAESKASQLLRKVNVRAAVDKLTERKEAKQIADAIERDEHLTKIIRSHSEAPVVIQAIKELNKVEGRHIYRHQVTGRITLEQALGASHEEEA